VVLIVVVFEKIMQQSLRERERERERRCEMKLEKERYGTMVM
jgi:hypothetical protein